MFSDFVEYVQSLYDTAEFIPLHEPRFWGNEKHYVNQAIDSTFVSSVGDYVEQFEQDCAKFIGAKHAIAMVNGTAALHIALKLSGVEPGDEVICQPLTFVATCNAINYCQAEPVFVDIDRDTLSLSPEKLRIFLEYFVRITDDGVSINTYSGKKIHACILMHTFGHPGRLHELQQICDQYHICLIEDAAEALGSYYQGQHVGLLSNIGVFSFNGNKIITTGGGGLLVTNHTPLALRAKHITTTAKVAHPWEYEHDQVGYNYRMPNLNAALGCAQLEQLPLFLEKKRELALQYRQFFDKKSVEYIDEPEGCQANYWLNTILLNDHEQRHHFLEYSNQAGVMTRPVWQLMNQSVMYQHALADNLDNALFIAERLVNIPSSVPLI